MAKKLTSSQPDKTDKSTLLVMSDATLNRLLSTHDINHSQLEKTLIGIPALAAALAGALLNSSSSHEPSIFMLLSFGCFIVAVISSLCSYFATSLTIYDFLTMKQKTESDYEVLTGSLHVGARLYNFTTFTLTIIGLAFLFLSLIKVNVTL